MNFANNDGRTMLAIATLIVLSASSMADETDDDRRVAEALRITTAGADAYAIEIADGSGIQLRMHPDSLLRWSNTVAGEIYGNVFVWTHQGRPHAIGSLHQWFSPHTHGADELHSLSAKPLRATRHGNVVWATDRRGLEMKRFGGMPPVATTPSVRLRQMRAHARRFTVTKTDRDQVSREMRLLPQPIYRYQPDARELTDGAIFAFVQGTDPEVFLIVEAIGPTESAHWRYGFVRMNSVRLVAKLDQRNVWEVDILPWAEAKNPRQPYTSRRTRG